MPRGARTRRGARAGSGGGGGASARRWPVDRSIGWPSLRSFQAHSPLIDGTAGNRQHLRTVKSMLFSPTAHNRPDGRRRENAFFFSISLHFQTVVPRFFTISAFSLPPRSASIHHPQWKTRRIRGRIRRGERAPRRSASVRPASFPAAPRPRAPCIACAFEPPLCTSARLRIRLHACLYVRTDGGGIMQACTCSR